MKKFLIITIILSTTNYTLYGAAPKSGYSSDSDEEMIAFMGNMHLSSDKKSTLPPRPSAPVGREPLRSMNLNLTGKKRKRSDEGFYNEDFPNSKKQESTSPAEQVQKENAFSYLQKLRANQKRNALNPFL